MANECEFYSPFIDRFILNDQRLIELIKNEIPNFNDEDFEDLSDERMTFSNDD